MQIDITGPPDDAPELKLSALLDQYRELREERLQHATRRQQAVAGLLLTGLQQRFLSSGEAFARTLRVHRRTVHRQWEAAQADAGNALLHVGQSDLLTGWANYIQSQG